jgi:hypothetical protein
MAFIIANVLVTWSYTAEDGTKASTNSIVEWSRNTAFNPTFPQDLYSSALIPRTVFLNEKCYYLSDWAVPEGEVPTEVDETTITLGDSTYNYTYICTAEAIYKVVAYYAKNINLFEDAEPYHYGEGFSTEEYFDHSIDKDGAPDLKVQKWEDNGYSVQSQVSQLRIKGNYLTYIQQGSFPLYTPDAPVITVDKINGSAGGVCRLEVIYDEKTDYKTIESINLVKSQYMQGSSSLDTADEVRRYYLHLAYSPSTTCIYDRANEQNSLQKSLFKKHKNEKYPTHLGFILSGGGGGAGGISQYDADKDGKASTHYITAGGGGGGGEIIYGVFDLTPPTWLNYKVSRLYFIITLGKGGSAGTNGGTDATYNNPKPGTEGYDGGPSRVWVTALRASATVQDTSQWSTPVEVLSAAQGGGGFQGETKAAGGAGTGGNSGGKYSGNIYTLKNNCCLCGVIQGGKGGSGTTANTQVGGTIYFSKTEPEDTKFKLDFNYEAQASTAPAKDSTDQNNRKAAKIPGGHSIRASGSAVGGCGGSIKDGSPQDGAPGMLELYY